MSLSTRLGEAMLSFASLLARVLLTNPISSFWMHLAYNAHVRGNPRLAALSEPLQRAVARFMVTAVEEEDYLVILEWLQDMPDAPGNSWQLAPAETTAAAAIMNAMKDLGAHFMPEDPTRAVRFDSPAQMLSIRGKLKTDPKWISAFGLSATGAAALGPEVHPRPRIAHSITVFKEDGRFEVDEGMQFFDLCS